MDRKRHIEELIRGYVVIRRKMMAAKGKGSLNITPAQWSVIMLLGEKDECTIKDIAAQLGITSSAATQLVDGLMKSGVVVRATSKADRRVVAVSLTSKMKDKVSKMKEHAIQEFLSIFNSLDDGEFAQFCTLHRKLVGGINK